MLKEMIERRQRNDFVRRREFDMLRKLRRREADGGRDAAATSLVLQRQQQPGKTEGRALTLKKIDEIEEQMSQQWWKNRRHRGEPADGAPGRPGGPACARLCRHRARRRAARGGGDAARGPAPSAHRPSRLVGNSAIEEAVDPLRPWRRCRRRGHPAAGAGARTPAAEHDDTWRALLDFYRAIGDADKFAAAGARATRSA